MRLLLASLSLLSLLNAEVLLKEEFNTLENWEPLTFEKIETNDT